MIFDQLLAAQGEIERAFGGPLGWERLDDKRACRIRADLAEGTVRDQANWAAMQDRMIDAMIRLDRALRPRLDALSTQ